MKAKRKRAAAPKKKKHSGRTLTQAERRKSGAKLVISVTLSADVLAALDAHRDRLRAARAHGGEGSRSKFVEDLIARAVRS